MRGTRFKVCLFKMSTDLFFPLSCIVFAASIFSFLNQDIGLFLWLGQIETRFLGLAQILWLFSFFFSLMTIFNYYKKEKKWKFLMPSERMLSYIFIFIFSLPVISLSYGIFKYRPIKHMLYLHTKEHQLTFEERKKNNQNIYENEYLYYTSLTNSLKKLIQK